MARIIETWGALLELSPYYPFGGDGRGGTFHSGLRTDLHRFSYEEHSAPASLKIRLLMRDRNM